ncbi:MAG: hypothetical protein AAF927_02325 [Bacteroidota bacterium]
MMLTVADIAVIEDQVMNNHLNEAIGLLLNYLPLEKEYLSKRKEIVMTKVRMTTVQQERRSGSLSFEQYLSYKSQIEQALLEIVYEMSILKEYEQ